MNTSGRDHLRPGAQVATRNPKIFQLLRTSDDLVRAIVLATWELSGANHNHALFQ